MTYIDPDLGSRNWERLIRVENGVAIEETRAPFGWFTETGQRPCDEWLATEGYYGFVPSEGPDVLATECTYSLNPIREWAVDEESKTVSPTWNIVYYTEEEKIRNEVQLDRSKWEAMRSARNVLLSQTDWTQLPDVDPALSAEWREYRQALRDLPSNITDIDAFFWPTRPGEEFPMSNGGPSYT